jgi:putative Ca2+/H+ antiporter (TMEM165/GDT1 family)
MISEFLIPFVAIALAELGDKTQLSVLLLSTRTRQHVVLFFGVMMAFLLVDGFAILVGSWITDILPINVIKTASGVLFILFGALILRDFGKDEGEEDRMSSTNPFFSGFLLVFLAEWGDKTQIASALFATHYNSWMVLLGTMAALCLLSAMAIYLGKVVLERIDKKMISKVAGSLFILIGISFLVFL